MVLEKTLESPLDCKEISPGTSLGGMMLKLKLQYFGHLMRRVDSLGKTRDVFKKQLGIPREYFMQVQFSRSVVSNSAIP